MPVQKFSAMDPSGTWQMDARDQTAMWNADRGDRINMWQTNRLDQRGQDDWRKEVALKQLGLNEKMYTGGREDSAAERAAKYGFMGEELGLRREESATNRGLQERGFGLQERGFNFQEEQARQMAKERQEDRARGTPLLDMQSQIAQLQLARMQQQEANRSGAAGASAYAPTTDEGKQEYQSNLAMTGDPLQAGFAAKGAERTQAGQRAEAAKIQLESMLQDFKAKDAAVIGWDPTPQDQQAIYKQAEAVKLLMKQAGVPDDTAAEMIKKILRDNLTAGGRTDWNQAPSEEIISRYGGSFR